MLSQPGPAAESLEADSETSYRLLTNLRRECVEAKEALSVDSVAVVYSMIPGGPTSLRVTRSELEALVRPARSFQTVDVARRALASAKVAAADLDSIVLVGGDSRIPLVTEILDREFGVPIRLDTHPKHDIALGAARSAKESLSAGADVGPP